MNKPIYKIEQFLISTVQEKTARGERL